MTGDAGSDDADSVIARKNEILRQLNEADGVRGCDAICSEFDISIDEFNERYVIYRMTLEMLGHNEDATFDQIDRDKGVLTDDEMNFAKTDQHQWVLNRVRMRLAMERFTPGDREQQ